GSPESYIGPINPTVPGFPRTVLAFFCILAKERPGLFKTELCIVLLHEVLARESLARHGVCTLCQSAFFFGRRAFLGNGGINLGIARAQIHIPGQVLSAHCSYKFFRHFSFLAREV